MAQGGALLMQAMKARMIRGIDVTDKPTPPLSRRYEKRKAKLFPPAIRNNFATGRTFSAMAVTQAAGNQVKIDIPDPAAKRRVGENDVKGRLWGVSPADDRVAAAFLDAHKDELVTVRKA